MSRLHIPGVPEAKAEAIAEAMQRPEGTITFIGTYPDLLVDDGRSGLLLEIVIGRIVFRLVRDGDLTLRFVHATPGKGTHEAALSLAELGEQEEHGRFFFALVWSPTTTRLHLGAAGGEHLLQGSGVPASYALQVASDGSVVEVGGPGVEVMGARMYRAGTETSSPSAIDTWSDTRSAADTLLDGESTAGYLLEVVAANAVLGMLVTGFETYTSGRFVELDDEGVPLDFGSVAAAFLSAEERSRMKAGNRTALEEDAIRRRISRSAALADRINFQNYANAKKAFNRGYGLRFGDLTNTTSQRLERVQRLIKYRHRVAHVSPLLGLLNGPECPPEEPFFANRDTMREATREFDLFIRDLHDSTLGLRPAQ
ncbi:hypothetical protein NHL50_10475 [Acidimicrobiia bacterium EGI L10123]|uniref:hypothetical protein n=1 Tax=Salinilacustrithrix flava TaxID=2957203 RepID=UPI003D7C3658|nr:hypothetical protein [Acidimicrobiia bacterium EGI L10123]